MIRRLFVEQKTEYNSKALDLKEELENLFSINIEDLRIFDRYDIEGLSDYVFDRFQSFIFYEPSLEYVYTKNPTRGYRSFAIEPLTETADTKAENAETCIRIISAGDEPKVKTATVYAFSGVADTDFEKIKAYIINPLVNKEAMLDLPDTLKVEYKKPQNVLYDSFISLKNNELQPFYDSQNFAISFEDLKLIQDYFKDIKRNPTETEIKVLDTLWSDHVKHSVIDTEITSININSDNPHIERAYSQYKRIAKEFSEENANSYVSLRDIATIAIKKLQKQGRLKNLVTTLERNVSAIDVDVDVNGKNEKWVVMFKTETANSPTEIEPYGGAATGLSAAVLDPLTGRSFTYQAMRVSGSADPRDSKIDLQNKKLSQKTISTKSAMGHAEIGTQIGVPTGLSYEMYHENYKAKHLEANFVIGAGKKENMMAAEAECGDIIMIVGEKTSRVGCGAASAASRKDTDIKSSSFEKGDPLISRALQRLVRRKEATSIVKRCTDVSTGGLAVALLESARSFDVNLNLVPRVDESLSGTEIAISETQDRIVVVLDDVKQDEFIKIANQENLAATKIATVTDSGLVRMFYNGDTVVNLNRDFVDLKGVKVKQDVVINEKVTKYMNKPSQAANKFFEDGDFRGALLADLSRLNVCSQKGRAQMCDSTINSNTIFMPYGGKYQETESIVMAAKIPVNGETDTATVASFGCSPYLMSESPFVGSIYSIIISISKQIAAGVKLGNIKLNLQQYFKNLGNDKERWGEPTSALLGALYAQLNLGICSIGGKDSMNGTFGNLDVPPTIISFACGISKASKLISNDFNEKSDAKNIYRIHIRRDEYGVPDFDDAQKVYLAIGTAIENGDIVSANVVEEGGAISAVFKSCMGNRIGTTWEEISEDLFAPLFGDFVVQASDVSSLAGLDVKLIAKINGTRTADLCGEEFKFGDAFDAYTKTLDDVYPTVYQNDEVENVSKLIYCVREIRDNVSMTVPPKVLIPVFPGTTCEYDMARAFEKAGAETNILVIRNRTRSDIEESITAFRKAIIESQILALPGGFSDSDIMDTSKYIVSMFEKSEINDAFMNMIYDREGLALGIGNGFQAFVKLGFIPYGKLTPQTEKSCNFIKNDIGHHVSSIVRTRIATNKTPWFDGINIDTISNVPISCGMGKFVASKEELEKILNEGLVATQYVDNLGDATMVSPYNPTGSTFAIEGLISPDGHILGKMGHSERVGKDLYKNIRGSFDMDIFKAGVDYFK